MLTNMEYQGLESVRVRVRMCVQVLLHIYIGDSTTDRDWTRAQERLGYFMPRTLPYGWDFLQVYMYVQCIQHGVETYIYVHALRPEMKM